MNRWLILGVLFVARFTLGFQFQSAGSVTPFIVEDFAVDYTGIGTLVGLFMIPGLFLAVPSGFMGRRFGDKAMVLVGLALMLAGGAMAGAGHGPRRSCADAGGRRDGGRGPWSSSVLR